MELLIWIVELTGEGGFVESEAPLAGAPKRNRRKGLVVARHATGLLDEAIGQKTVGGTLQNIDRPLHGVAERGRPTCRVGRHGVLREGFGLRAGRAVGGSQRAE